MDQVNSGNAKVKLGDPYKEFAPLEDHRQKADGFDCGWSL